MTFWNVYLNGKEIDSVPYDKSYKTAEEVKQSLVNHDGYDSGIFVRRAPGQLPRPFVGLNHAERVREVFRFTGTPTETDTPKYKAVIGPFRTMRAARYMADHGGNGNPHLLSVEDAERITAQDA